MPRQIVDRRDAIEAVLKRADDCRMTQADLSRAADVTAATITRAKSLGRIDLKTLDKLELAVTKAEKERAEAAA